MDRDRPDWRIGAVIAIIAVLIVLGAFALVLAHIDASSRHEAGTMLTTTT
jgi:hypothetical protein